MKNEGEMPRGLDVFFDADARRVDPRVQAICAQWTVDQVRKLSQLVPGWR